MNEPRIQYDTKLLTKLSTFVGTYMNHKNLALATDNPDSPKLLSNQTEQYVKIVKLILDGIGYTVSQQSVTPVLQIYIGESNPNRPPDSLVTLPTFASPINLHPGTIVMVDEQINERWPMFVGQVKNWPYEGRTVIPLITLVKDEEEYQELVKLIGLRLGCDVRKA